ncbi:hypothetical protein SpCBS45565_g04872 [Spizellomyces sp. 'palustris']|nr:hypothetical protein SpCBS45565_g04872 [Spizellomyces sp. 'palustris']
MIRIPRLLLLSANFVLIVLAFAAGILAYMLFLNTSPFPKTQVFPIELLIGIAILCPLLLGTGLVGCCGLYRLSPGCLKIFICSSLLLCGAYGLLGHLAMREMDASFAISMADQMWKGATNDTRGTIMREFRCCGWEEGASASDYPSLDPNEAQVLSKLCMASTSCSGPVTEYRIALARSIMVVMFSTLGFVVLIMLLATWMLLALKTKRSVNGKKRDLEGCHGNKTTVTVNGERR